MAKNGLPHPVKWWLSAEDDGHPYILVECICDCGQHYVFHLNRPDIQTTKACGWCGKEHALKLLFKVDGHVAGAKKKESV